MSDQAAESSSTVVEQLIQNQERYFARCDQDDPLMREWLTRRVGSPEEILQTLRAIYTSHTIFKLFAVQPLSQPVGIVHNYSHSLLHRETDESTGEQVPTVLLKLERTAVRAETRTVFYTRPSRDIAYYPRPKGVTCQPVEPTRTMREDTTALLKFCLSEAVNQLLRELVGHLRTQAYVLPAPVGVSCADQLSRGRHMSWRRSGRGLANRLVVSYEDWVTHAEALAPISNDPVADNLVGVDMNLPAGEAIVWYAGKSQYDATMIWAPYHFVFHRDDVALRIDFRHAFRLAYPSAIVTVQLPAAKPG